MLRSLTLRNFRNYKETTVSFSPSVNLILGDNGQGKTNLLEAIYLISIGRSFRTRRLSELIRKGEKFFYLEAHFTKDGVEQSLKVSYEENSRKVQYNSTVFPHFTSLLGILPGVLLSPEDHSLISGSPAERRRFLDLHIAQMDPLYVHHLGRYFRAMKQRNQLLRTQSEATLNAWEEVMAHSATYLIQKRREALAALDGPIGQWMERLSLGKESLQVDYNPSIPGEDPSTLMGEWRKSRAKEMHFGATLIGPHRDDLKIRISERDAKSFSSEGQKRCSATSLRFAEWERFRESMDLLPLMGIDDFGIQLDLERRALLQEQMRNLGQVFLTSPQPLSSEFFQASDAVIRVENGIIAGA